jgi:PAS domain S-box-containing protein
LQDIDFRQVFQNLPGMFLILQPNADFMIEEVSEAYLRSTQTERSVMIGRPLFDVFPEREDEGVPAMGNLRTSLERVIATRAPDTMDTLRYDLPVASDEVGAMQERYWSPVNSPVLSANGDLLYIIHRVDDTTALVQRKRGEQDEHARMAEINKRFQAIYDQGLFASWLDLHGVVVDANRPSLEQCGYVRNDVIGKPFWDCPWWNRSPTVQNWIRSGVAQAIRGESFSGTTPYFCADGSERFVDFTCMPIRSEAGVVQFVAAKGIDVTDRVRADKNLLATEILESIAEGFFGLDHDWRFTYVNREAEIILGKTRHDLVGKSLWDTYPGLHGHELAEIYVDAMTRRIAGSRTSYYADHDRWYEVHTYPAPEGASVYFRNVTEQKRADAERDRLVAASEQQRRIYEAALSNTPDFVYVVDLEHRFTYVNEALIKMWGQGDPRGKTWIELGYEQWHADMHDREIDEVIATRAPIRGEIPFTGTNGRRIYDYIFVPVFGSSGDVVAVAGTTRDVTERQQAEQAIREQAERLAQTDRAKDEFLATLSHELRNPLAALRNSITLMRLSEDGQLPTHQQSVPINAMMERQLNHLVRLVDDLLETSRIRTGTFALRKERVALSAIVRHAVETSQLLVESAGHQLDVSIPDEVLWLDGDSVRLAQILANVLDNATKYTPDGGHISIHARREANNVIIAVRDDGPGISSDALPGLFEMFTRGDRNNARGEGGLGIGLALARRLAEMHGGTLTAHSEGSGKGSEFRIQLPLASAQAADKAGPAAVESSIPQQRILVVDDNRDAAESMAMILTLLGANVCIANDGHEALTAFSTHTPSVVLLDISMPGMDGYEVARAIRTRFPSSDASIIALSGWGQEEDRRLAREAGFDHHLIKPAEIGALQALLASLEERASI